MPEICPNCQSPTPKRVKTLLEGELANTPIASRLATPSKPPLPLRPPSPEQVVWGGNPPNRGFDESDLNGIVGGYFFLCILPLFFMESSNNWYWPLSSILFGLGLAWQMGWFDSIWLSIIYPESDRQLARQKYQKELEYYEQEVYPVWQSQLKKWEQLYRCSACGLIYLQGQINCVESDQLNQLIGG